VYSDNVRKETEMSTIVIVSVAIIAFALGTVFGVLITCKTIADGKVKNVKVIS
jgi:hypothetical protein